MGSGSTLVTGRSDAVDYVNHYDGSCEYLEQKVGLILDPVMGKDMPARQHGIHTHPT